MPGSSDDEALRLTCRVGHPPFGGPRPGSPASGPRFGGTPPAPQGGMGGWRGRRPKFGQRKTSCPAPTDPQGPWSIQAENISKRSIRPPHITDGLTSIDVTEDL